MAVHFGPHRMDRYRPMRLCANRSGTAFPLQALQAIYQSAARVKRSFVQRGHRGGAPGRQQEDAHIPAHHGQQHRQCRRLLGCAPILCLIPLCLGHKPVCIVSAAAIASWFILTQVPGTCSKFKAMPCLLPVKAAARGSCVADAVTRFRFWACQAIRSWGGWDIKAITRSYVTETRAEAVYAAGGWPNARGGELTQFGDERFFFNVPNSLVCFVMTFLPQLREVRFCKPWA